VRLVLDAKRPCKRQNRSFSTAMFYCKCYPTFDLASVLLHFDRSQAHEWGHRLLPVLESALGHKLSLPERKLRNVEEFVERFPEVRRVMIDGTERPIQRPHFLIMQQNP